MARIATFLLLVYSSLSLDLWTCPAVAQLAGQGLVSGPTARRVGLERVWANHQAIDPARDRIGWVVLQVSDQRTFTVLEIKDGQRAVYFSERAQAPVGRRTGIEAAQRQANDLIETYKALGRQPELTERTVSESTLYVQSISGVLQAIDADSGRTIWSVQVGRAGFPCLAPAASEKYVATINGSQLYLLDAREGTTVWQRRLDRLPGAGPVITDTYAIVPTLHGLLEAYPIENSTGTPILYSCSGDAVIQPTVSRQSLSWPTDAGFLYVSEPDQLALRFRLESRRPFVSPSTRQPPDLLYVASADGTVYALNELNGDILWRHAMGESASQSPIPIGDSLYVVTDYAGMYSLSTSSGEPQWTVNGVRQFVSASADRVYVLTHGDSLAVLDVKTGASLGHIPALGLDVALTNAQTDRLFVGNTSGMLQCLHEPRLPWPLRHVIEPVPSDGQPDAPPDETAPAAPSVPADAPGQPGLFPDDEPLDGGPDPFGIAPLDAMNDQFDPGDAADPFGQDGDDDPFN